MSFRGQARSDGLLGAAVPAEGVSVGRAFLVELLFTFILVLVVVSVATDERAHGAVAPIAVGSPRRPAPSWRAR